MQARVYLSILLFVSALAFTFHATSADEAVHVKAANDALRQSQNAMFSRKFDEALQKLSIAEEAIAALEAENPENTQLKTLRNKASKMKTDLERKLASSTPGPSASAGANPSVGSTAALPRDTREAHRLLEKAIQSLETSQKKRLEKVISGESTEGGASFVAQSVERKIKEAGELATALEEAANKDNAIQHPTVVSAIAQTRSVTKAIEDLIRTVLSAEQAPEVDASSLTAMPELLERFRTEWLNPIVNAAYEQDFAKTQEAWQKLEHFNKAVRPSIQAQIDAFAAKYGSDRDAIEKALGDSAPGIAWDDIRRELKRLDGLPSEIHVRVMDQLRNMITALDRNHDFFRIEQQQDTLAVYGIALATATDPATVPDVPAIIEADTKAWADKISQVEWPECMGDSETQKAAKAYLLEHWEKDPKHHYTLIGFAITGDWSVQTRSLGSPTSYGIPVKVALQEPQDKEAGLARVFDLTLRTAVSDKPEKTPPFVSDTVGNSWYIRASKVTMPTE